MAFDINNGSSNPCNPLALLSCLHLVPGLPTNFPLSPNVPSASGCTKPTDASISERDGRASSSSSKLLTKEVRRLLGDEGDGQAVLQAEFGLFSGLQSTDNIFPQLVLLLLTAAIPEPAAADDMRNKC
jgi:hypothetical protein